MSNKSNFLKDYLIRPFTMTKDSINDKRIGYEDMIHGKKRKALKKKRKQERANKRKGRK